MLNPPILGILTKVELEGLAVALAVAQCGDLGVNPYFCFAFAITRWHSS